MSGTTTTSATARLIFCMTPLQSLIAARIQGLRPAKDTVIYQPHTNSLKHKYYFDRIKADQKEFVDWIPDEPSSTLKQIRSFFAIPRWIRSRDFDEYLVASFDSIPFSLLHAGKKGVIRTFDDGVLNLLPSEMNSRLQHEHRALAALKRLAGGKDNKQTVSASIEHYTIFDPEILYPAFSNITKIDLFSQTKINSDRGSVKILLGSYLPGFATQSHPGVVKAYERLVETFPCDVFVPHPADAQRARIASWLPERGILAEIIDHQIAEDVVLHLSQLGYDVTLYGVASTALINLANQIKTVNIVIPGLNETETAVFEACGVQSMPLELDAPT